MRPARDERDERDDHQTTKPTRGLRTMEPEKLLEAVTTLIEGLRADMVKIGAKCDAAVDSIKKRDEAGSRSGENEDDRGGQRDMAKRVAADSASDIQVANSLLNGLARDMSALKKQVSRPMSDLNAYADAQAKADSVMRALGSSAEPPMSGEELIPYQIRMHRKMQPHSKKWKGVDLGLIAADRAALDNVLSEIRADAVAYSMTGDDLPMCQPRKITKTTPTGHTITEWVGNGTFVKAMSRPVRYVTYIGARHQAGAPK
jgi:hypothetical protein